MKADVANYNLYPIPEAFHSGGGFMGRLEGRPTLEFDRVLDEVHRLFGTDTKQLRTDFEHLMDTAADLSGKYLANIRLGKYALLRPFMGGQVQGQEGQV